MPRIHMARLTDQAIGSLQSNKRAGRIGILRLWNSSDLRLSRSFDYGLSALSDTCERHQRSRLDCTKLVQTRILETSIDRDSVVQKN